MSVKAAERAYRTADAAVIKGVQKESLLRAIRTGALPAKKWGRGYLISASDLDSWFDGLEDA